MMNSLISKLKQVLTLEAYYQPKLDYFNSQISFDSIKTLVEWILQITLQEHQHIDVFHLSVGLIHQLLSRLNKSNFVVDKSSLQLLGSSCLLIASKLRDGKPVSTFKLIEYSDYLFNLNQLLDYEQFVLQTLRWDTESVTPSDYFDLIMCYLEINDSDDSIKTKFNSLSMMCAMNIKLSGFSSSKIAFTTLISILNQSNQIEIKNKLQMLMIDLRIDLDEINSICDILDTECNNNSINCCLTNNSLGTQGLLDLALFKDFLDEELFIDSSTEFNDSLSDTSELTKSLDESYTFLLTPPTIYFTRIQTF